MDNILTAGLYSILTAIVAFYYWLEGQKKGIHETLMVFREHEPEALKRIQRKLREILNVAES